MPVYDVENMQAEGYEKRDKNVLFNGARSRFDAQRNGREAHGSTDPGRDRRERREWRLTHA
ncbi:MAG: hypothetical protein ACLFUM_12105 [Spirochaetaceae bacterium]